MGKFKKFKQRGKKLKPNINLTTAMNELKNSFLELEQSFINRTDYLLKLGTYTNKEIADILKKEVEPLLTLYSETILDLRQPQSNDDRNIEQIVEPKKVNQIHKIN